MLSNYLSPLVLTFAAFRLVLALALVAVGFVLWKRPRPAAALAVLIAVQLVAAAAYLAPLERPYAFSAGTDRAFNIGMAACVTEGLSPFQHTQVGFGSPQPLWNLVVASLALFRVENVALAYAALTPLALAAVALALFCGLRGEGVDAWERVFWVFSVFMLSSFTMSRQPPAPVFWMGNFLMKPNHGSALALVALAAGLLARPRVPAVRLGLVLGLLAWASLMNWGYLVVGVFIYLWWYGEGPVRRGSLAGAFVLSALVAAPYVFHLAKGYSPLESHGAARHMWNDLRGLPLAIPNWTTLDLGPLLTLAAVGGWIWYKRARPTDRALAAVGLGAVVLWVLSIPAALIGVAPEPDELHYYVRFILAIAAGTALAAAARHVESLRSWAPGRGAIAVMAFCLPMSFPLWWDPPTMDRYYTNAMMPFGPKMTAGAEWIRENTTPHTVFAAGPEAATWIPALAGRQVLLNEGGMLQPPDHDARKAAQAILVGAEDAALVREAAHKFGVTHVAIDASLLEEYQVTNLHDLPRAPSAYRVAFQNSNVRIVVVEAVPARAEGQRP